MVFGIDDLLVGSVVAPAVGGLIGNIFGGGKDAKAAAERQKALEQWLKLHAPSIDEQKVVYDKLKSAGFLTPELEQTFQQSDSEMKNVSVDPRLKQAQLDALLKMQGVSDEGGLDVQDKAKLNEIRSQVAQQEKGSRDAIMQNMAMRGASGSGMELAAQLANQQGSANRLSKEGFDVGAEARGRALQAMMQSGQMAGSMRSQDFSEQSAVAQAQDAINKFNTANRQQVSGQNVDRSNQAQAANLQNAQSIADKNVAISNAEQDHNKGLVQKQFDNETTLAKGVSGQYADTAKADAEEAERQRKMWGGIGQGVGQGFAGAYADSKKK